ncbi:redoxin domain-containing protein [Pedobacter nyackensis]|uniref:redoxin domain-containing protein n=1 Tax=Pedobacter nyackensis TaxID=475255 RepID=UPI00292EAFF7|nr:redoxin domain-containing protein [Pedobacter nyackensis]
MTRAIYYLTLFIITLSIFYSTTLSAQSDFNIYPKIGSSCPDFTLTGFMDSTTKKVSLADFKGKWLVLDFWTRSCSSCISSFPKMNALQKEFKDRIEFALVGNNEQRYNKGIEDLYRGISKRQGLELTAVFDSVLFKRFGVTSTPHLILIDPSGVVRAITYSSELNSNSLKSFLSGAAPGLSVKLNVLEQKAKDERRVDPFVLFRSQYRNNQLSSMLSKWTSDHPVYNIDQIKEGDSIYRTTAMSLRRLYNIAFLGKTDWGINDSLYGKQWPVPVLKLKDTSLFITSMIKEQGLYNYGLMVPEDKTDLKSIRNAMQEDLKKHFGYNVTTEKQNMPCFLLTLNEGQRSVLTTKGGEPVYRLDKLNIDLINTSVNAVVQLLWDARLHGWPIIDKTGLNSNIDLSLHADMGNFKDLVVELEKKGLYLTKGTVEMDVLVIKD